MSEEQVTRRTAVSAIGISVAALAAGGLAFVNSSADQPIGGGGGVASLNALTGALDITAGAGISVTPSGSNIQIAATGGGGGDTITSPNSTLNVGGTSSNTTLDVNAAAFPLSFIPGTDNTLTVGSSAERWASFNGGSFNSYTANTDTVAEVSVTSLGVNFGAGGASAQVLGLQPAIGSLRFRNGVLLTRLGATAGPELALAPSGSGASDSTHFTIYRTSNTGTNAEFAGLSSDFFAVTSFGLGYGAFGSGTVRPFIGFLDNNTVLSEVWRMTPSGNFQFQPTTATILGSSTGYTTLTTANASATDYTATFPANTGTVAELNLVQTFTQVIQTSQNGDTSNTGFGTGALNVNTGSYNSAFGYYAGGANTTGGGNSFFGLDAGYSNTTGNYNSFFGLEAGYYNTTGGGNSFFGLASGYYNTTGGGNSFFGFEAGYYNTTGGYNSFFGQSAGMNFNDTTGAVDNLVLIGYNAGSAYTGAERNDIILGANVSGTAGESNVTRIANSSTTNYYLGSSPAARVTGDLYLVFDPTTKEIHLSAIGPAS